MGKLEQQGIAKYFAKKPILYIGGLGDVLTPHAGILLSQLLYWVGKGRDKDGWIYKTANELQAETGLTRSNQETSIKLLRNLGIIDYKVAQVPARRHFKVNMLRLHEVLPSLKESRKLKYPNPTNYYVQSTESITKITRKTTTISTVPESAGNKFKDQRRDIANDKSVRGP